MTKICATLCRIERTRTVKALCVLLGAAAFAAAGSVASIAATSGVPLGQSLSGENCQLAGGRDIVCGGGTGADGMLRVSQLPDALPKDASSRRAAIVLAAKSQPGGLSTAQDVTCDAGQWLAPQG